MDELISLIESELGITGQAAMDVAEFCVTHKLFITEILAEESELGQVELAKIASEFDYEHDGHMGIG